MARRQHGTGSIYQRDDGRWIGRIEAGWTANGTRRRISVSGKTQAEAKKKLRDAQRKINEEGKDAATSRITVKAWADTWLPLYAERVRPNVYVTTKGHIRKWIVPTIGTKQLAALKPDDARKIEKAILDAGRSSSTARGVDSALRVMLRDAKVEGHHVPDGILSMQRPSLADSDRDAIPTDQAIKLLRKAEGAELPRFMLALAQAMRQAEVLGLTWDCVDLDNGLIDVSWQLKEVPSHKIPAKYRSRHLIGSYYLLQPKTDAGNRIVPLSPPAWAALKTWADIAPPNPWNLVFVTYDTRNGRDGTQPLPRRADTDRETWKQLQKDAGIARPNGKPWRLHEARHTTATLLLEAGVDPHVVTAIMGQSSIVVARGYQHVRTDLARAALDQATKLLDFSHPAE